MNQNFLDSCKITRVNNAAGAAQTDIDSARVLMDGFDSVAFVALLGDVTNNSAIELKVMQNTADHATVPTPAEITDEHIKYTSDGTADDNKLLVAEVKRIDPAKGRYLFARLKRGTANAVVDGILAIQFNARDLPVEQSATVFKQAFLHVK